MKLTDNPTDWIIVNAHLQSEWDYVHFVLINISSDAWRKEILRRIELSQQFYGENFKNEYGFYHTAFWSSPHGWYITGDCDLTDALENEYYSFVEITDEELAKLETPENVPDAQQMHIDREGHVCYKAWGKYSGEEFWTETIPFKELFKLYEDAHSEV